MNLLGIGVVIGAAFQIGSFITKKVLELIFAIPEMAFSAIDKTLKNTWHK